MREIFKNILGILILATLAYVVFVSFNVYQFTKTDESKITSEGYSQQINLLKEGLENAENNFSKTSIKDSSKNVGINFDGTPIVWVIELEQSQVEISLENIENELFDQGFITAPEPNNAVALLRDVLRLDPDNEQADRQLGQCANRLAEVALQAREVDMFDQAREYLALALAIRPDVEQWKRWQNEW